MNAKSISVLKCVIKYWRIAYVNGNCKFGLIFGIFEKCSSSFDIEPFLEAMCVCKEYGIVSNVHALKILSMFFNGNAAGFGQERYQKPCYAISWP